MLLPFLAGQSLDRAIAKWDAVCLEDGSNPLPAQTIRRSESGHYGCCKHALKYLLICSGLETAEIRRISLLLRLQMFRLAQHDLRFTMQDYFFPLLIVPYYRLPEFRPATHGYSSCCCRLVGRNGPCYTSRGAS